MLTVPALPNYVKDFLHDLSDAGYEGEWADDAATRVINATDNSIYQILPQAVLFPRTGNDLNIVMQLAQKQAFEDIRFMPRGGGTGTNGQSLNACVTIDTSRYLNGILEINAQEKWVRVEPGVVLDQLNAALESFGLMFPVEISPSKSATLGGMVSTDACGKGSTVYGKTGDYIVSLKCILSDGREIRTDEFRDERLQTLLKENHARVCAEAPKLPRGLSGYDIRSSYNPELETLDMNRLITGSEGSLAILKEITLRIVPRPKHKTLFILTYDDFDAALRHVDNILAFAPTAIETIDDHILELAREDYLWHKIRDILPGSKGQKIIKAVHFVEFESLEEAALTKAAEAFKAYLDKDKTTQSYSQTLTQEERVSALAIRKKCVGLLGNMEGNRRPVPFIEDTAVPPERLADYIADLRLLLERYNLKCGMFGHSDAGCLHVRPALDLRESTDQDLIKTLTDEVVVLLKKYGGVLWGEHGKGLRGSYTEALAGTLYYKTMQDIKRHLDPFDRLNPGKIAIAGGGGLLQIDDIALRGEYDRQIDPVKSAEFPKATQCNGNGLCFSVMPDDTMCPSYKITRDRKHSPKGRAGLLREWLRLESVEPGAARQFSHEVYNALHGCLSCKACTSTCPIHVNIPDMKSRFLERYHRYVPHSVRDYIIAYSEYFLSFTTHVPVQLLALFGLCGAPKATGPSLKKLIRDNDFFYATPHLLKQVQNPVLIVQDSYTSTYEPGVVLAVLSFIRKLGFTPLVMPLFVSGKGFHVKGFLKSFRKIAAKNADFLQRWSQYGIAMVGIDPSMTLVYRDEYKQFTQGALTRVLLLQEWLDTISVPATVSSDTIYNLFLHCTEKNAQPEGARQWQEIFRRCGVTLNIVETGCCGMAGAYGYEAEHYDNSKNLYALSWYKRTDSNAVVTGFSCRSQAARFDNVRLRHPVEILNELL